VRPNQDSQAPQQEVAAVTMVLLDVADLGEDSEVAWVEVEVEVVKSTFLTFVTSFLSPFKLVLSIFC
jgi:hypothetical protein